MNSFDHNGDLWIELAMASIYMSQGVEVSSYSTIKDLGNGTYTAVTKMNLTQYIRSLISK